MQLILLTPPPKKKGKEKFFLSLASRDHRQISQHLLSIAHLFTLFSKRTQVLQLCAVYIQRNKHLNHRALPPPSPSGRASHIRSRAILTVTSGSAVNVHQGRHTGVTILQLECFLLRGARFTARADVLEIRCIFQRHGIRSACAEASLDLDLLCVTAGFVDLLPKPLRLAVDAELSERVVGLAHIGEENSKQESEKSERDRFLRERKRH